jgi:DNA polymerase III delta prime subunit
MHRVLEKISRVASGYLFVGPPDSSKAEDALTFAQRLGCGKFDLVCVQPDGASVKIEQIRDLQARVRYGPTASDYLLVIVERADEMTPDAAAAFLKTLEEPPLRVVFILLVEREDRIPATIVSRCQRIFFGEKPKKWEPDPEFAFFYEELKNIRRKSVLELFELSARLEKEKGRIEALLYDLIGFAREVLGNIRLVRVLLEAVKDLKKKANLRLTLDVACLKLYEAGN